VYHGAVRLTITQALRLAAAAGLLLVIMQFSEA
jgi:hypothetical protein